MKKLPSLGIILSALLLIANSSVAQTSFTSNTTTTAWNDSRWNNSTDAAPYTSAFTANSTVNFTSGNYSFAGMGAVTNVGNINVASGANVTFTATISTFATGGAVRTITVASGSTFDFNNTPLSTAAGTGFIKDGAGVLATVGSGYSGGFTLNAGTVIMRGVDAMGGSATNVLTLNGGTVASTGNRAMTDSKYGGGIVIGGNVQFGELATVVSIAGSTANLSFANTVSLGSETRTLTVGNNGTTTFSANISGSGGLSVTRNSGTSGAIILTASNGYTGTTTVIGGGELRLTGNGTISSSAGISIGSGVGTELDVTGVTPGTFSLLSNTAFMIGNTDGASGMINATGKTLNYNNTTLSLAMAGVLAEGSYSFNLFDGTTTGSINSFVLSGAYAGTFSSLASQNVGAAAFTFTDSTGVLSVVVVPEPHQYALMVAGLLVLVMVLRRERSARIKA